MASDEKPGITMEEVLRDIQNRPVVPIWPHLGMVLGLSRGAAYAAVARGEVEVLEIGRLKKPISAALRKRLQLEPAT